MQNRDRYIRLDCVLRLGKRCCSLLSGTYHSLSLHHPILTLLFHQKGTHTLEADETQRGSKSCMADLAALLVQYDIREKLHMRMWPTWSS